MQFHGVSQRCSSTVRHNGDVLRCDPTPHLRQHFNPISSPESAARHAWATLQRLSVARKHSGRPFREQNAAFHSRDNLGRPSREQNAPFRSRDNLGRPSREQIAPSRSRDALAYPFVSRTHRLAHETTSADPFVSRTRRLTHETTSELSCATGTLRELYGDSTGAPRCRRGETRASATHRETWCLSGR